MISSLKHYLDDFLFVQAGLASEPTFTLEKLDPWTSQTDIYVGDNVPMRLTIWLPQQSLTGQVELLTQYESSAIMTICDPQITHIGGNYGTLTATDVTITKYATTGDYRVSVFSFYHDCS